MQILKNKENKVCFIDGTYEELLNWLNLSLDIKLRDNDLLDLFIQNPYLQHLSIYDYYSNGFSKMWLEKLPNSNKQYQKFISVHEISVKTIIN